MPILFGSKEKGVYICYKRCIESGVETEALSEMLGHSSVTIALERYVYRTMEHKQSNINKFNEYMNNLLQS